MDSCPRFRGDKLAPVKTGAGMIKMQEGLIVPTSHYIPLLHFPFGQNLIGKPSNEGSIRAAPLIKTSGLNRADLR